MTSTTHTRTPHLHNDKLSDYNASAAGRNYGIALGVITAIYLMIVSAFSSEGEYSTGLRFAKHIFIVPIVWMAVAAYAKTLPEGRKFKTELILLARIAAWSSVVLVLLNVLFFTLTSGFLESLFLPDGEPLLKLMLSSGFLLFETAVFVMIIGFVILQAYKGKGSPED